MIFFNLNTLEEESCNNPEKFLALLWYHYSKALPRSRSLYKPAKVSLTGDSYLLNPHDLFNDKQTDILYKIQYIRLAARRDYTLYKQYKYKALNRSYFPDLLIANITHNPLLKITPTEIYFKYEER